MDFKMALLKIKAKWLATKDSRKINAILNEYTKYGETYNVNSRWGMHYFEVVVKVVPTDIYTRCFVAGVYKYVRPYNITEEQWNYLQNYYRVEFCKKLSVQEFYGSYGEQKSFWRHGFGYDFF